MSGEIARVIPVNFRAGNWKHKDFPPPVGISANVSPPFITLSMISACNGRKSSYPKYSFNRVFMVI